MGEGRLAVQDEDEEFNTAKKPKPKLRSRNAKTWGILPRKRMLSRLQKRL